MVLLNKYQCENEEKNEITITRSNFLHMERE